MSFIKLYLVSYSAFTNTHVPNDPTKKMAYWEHAPDLLSANSIIEAGDEAKQKLEAKWPQEKGWSMRSAVVVPITRQFVKQMSQLDTLGAFGSLKEIEENPIKVDLDPPNSYM